MASWNIDKKKRFVNPYQFAPVDFTVAPEREDCSKTEYDQDTKVSLKEKLRPNSNLLTGYIDCTLYPVGDIFIPNTSNDKIFGGKDVDGKDYHKEFDFYSYEDLSKTEKTKDSKGSEQPIIPASSIRGVIRSVYESLTNSCLSVLDDKPLSSRGIPFSHTDVQKLAGLIKKEQDKYVLYPAKRYALPIKNYGKGRNFTIEAKYHEGEKRVIKVLRVTGLKRDYRTGDKIKFASQGGNRVLNVIKDGTQGFIDGYLYLGEKISRKKNESIFVPNGPGESLDKKAIEHYKTSLAEYYRNDGVNKCYKDLKASQELRAMDTNNQAVHYGYTDLDIDNFDWDDTTKAYPVWYEKVNNKLYLSPALYGRNIYYKTEWDLFANHVPCTKQSSLCPACKLFGFVSEAGSDDAKTSRLQFTDAKLKAESKAEYQEPVAIKELSSPKTSSVEFYTKPVGNKWAENWNQADQEDYIWNYDWYINYRTEVRRQREYKIPQNWPFSKNINIEARGRKFYWHDLSPDKYKTEEKTKRNCTIRPLKGCLSHDEVDESFNQFQFKVYFDHLSTDELSALILALGLGSDMPRLAHKIGHGKSIGLGSTKIVVTDIQARKLTLVEDDNDPSILYQVKSIFSEGSYKFFAETAFKEFLEKTKDEEEAYLEDLILSNNLLSKDKKLLRTLIYLLDIEIMKEQTVSYPLGENLRHSSKEMKSSSANWFIGNRSLGDSVMAPSFNYILPAADSPDLSLPFFYYGEVRSERHNTGEVETEPIPAATSPTRAQRLTGTIISIARDKITIRVNNEDKTYVLNRREEISLGKMFGRKKICNSEISFSLQKVQHQPGTYRITNINRVV